jgi:UDP-N-acetylglucosamine 2-epimerase (non-hydrolysing)/GDP/UDP-N,N'-diacetylbacillosamine 2-epimerase (hydrolysing)
MRKICVVTGSRADYGLLYGLIKAIHEDPDLHLQLAVTGMHLSPEYGLTVREIEADGFPIAERIEILLASDTPVGVGKAVGLGVIGFVEAFTRLSPDIVVLLGDRFEIFAAAQAALVARIPVAHLHGGERTEGAIDEAIRHAITKMAHLHFVATETYRKRVIQLGEHPDTVFNFGAIGIDNIVDSRLMSRTELEAFLNYQLKDINFLITYHPVTLDLAGPEPAFREFLEALTMFPDAGMIFTMPNADMGNKAIADMIHAFAESHRGVKVVPSLGRIGYLSAVQHCDVVIGNSSSGIIEVPVFKKPTVNIGDRQKGREMGPTVIQARENRTEIADAIQLALSPAFRESIQNAASIYGNGGTARKIKHILKTHPLNTLLKKRFHDLDGIE